MIRSNWVDRPRGVCFRNAETVCVEYECQDYECEDYFCKGEGCENTYWVGEY